jgi:hypothetical protein
MMLGIASFPKSQKPQPHMPTLVRLAESVSGPAAAEETCTIVYLDSNYHSERISHKTGARPTAEVYEGVLSVADFNRLMRALQTKGFRKLKPPPRQSKGPAGEDADLLQIMVPRNDGVQDLNYPTHASRKRAEKALRPVLEWWKDHRSNLPPPLKHGVSHLCNPASSSSK